jgi:signal transduction histidine kinase
MGMFLIRDLVSPRTWLALVNHLAGLFIGSAVIFVVMAGLGFGLGLLPLALIGLPILGLTMRLAGYLAQLERARFGLLLDKQIKDWPAGTRPGFRWWIIPRLTILKDRASWAEIGYAVVRLPFSAVAVAVSFGMWTLGLVMLTLPLYNGLLPNGGAHIGGVLIHGHAVMLLSAVAGCAALLAAGQLTRGLAVADAALAGTLLSPPADVAVLTARVSQLEVSRERVIDAAEAERRRIERDLHDGAQQRLVALAMELGRAKAKFGDDVEGAMQLVDQAHAQAKVALTELRNLVRGVHPPVLTERGLDAALSGLAALCPVPADVRVDVPVRPKASIEAVAYFVVAEALTNIAKHSRASHANVVVEGHGYPGTLTVMISDDGIGGADSDGEGLRGLADRVSGADGQLHVESPSGGPTIIAVTLPCA